jgi:hypothetical protein
MRWAVAIASLLAARVSGNAAPPNIPLTIRAMRFRDAARAMPPGIAGALFLADRYAGRNIVEVLARAEALTDDGANPEDDMTYCNYGDSRPWWFLDRWHGLGHDHYKVTFSDRQRVWSAGLGNGALVLSTSKWMVDATVECVMKGKPGPIALLAEHLRLDWTCRELVVVLWAIAREGRDARVEGHDGIAAELREDNGTYLRIRAGGPRAPALLRWVARTVSVDESNGLRVMEMDGVYVTDVATEGRDVAADLMGRIYACPRPPVQW